MAEAADTHTTTVTTSTAEITVNRGYPTSWQGLLKIFKLICLFACLVCAAIIVNQYATHSQTQYCLAVAVIGFLAELVIFILYALGANSKWSGATVCAIILLIYHLLMGIMLYAACIILSGWGAWGVWGVWNNWVPTIRAYNAFGILALAGFALEIYFNVIWMRGGPELAAFRP